MDIKRLLTYSVLYITLITSCKKSDTGNPTPQPAAPTITSFTPLSGREGTEVIVTGTNFSTNASEIIVRFNGVTAVVTQATTTQLTVIVPTGAATGKITVTKTDQTATSAEPFTVKATVKKYLSKITLSEKNSDVIRDIWEWQYDGLKRVTEVSTTRQIPNVIPVTKVRFQYTGNEILPYFIEALPQVGSENMGLDAYITYGTDGRKIKDSAIYKRPDCGGSLLLANYNYKNDLISVQCKISHLDYLCTPGTPPGPPILYSDSVYLGSGNVVKVAQGLWQTAYSYTYDNRINPFQQLNIFSSFYTLGFDVGFRYWLYWESENDNLYIMGLNKNNITKIQPLTGSLSQTFTYTYDNDDYPTSAVITTNSSPNSTVVKVKYEYIQ